MSPVGEREIQTQRRVVAFFRDALGYAHLGDWRDRAGNANVNETVLTGWLGRRGYDERLITRAMHELQKAAAVGGNRTLYDANRAVYAGAAGGMGAASWRPGCRESASDG